MSLSQKTIELLKKAFQSRDPEEARKFTLNLPEIRDVDVTATVKPKGKKKSQ